MSDPENFVVPARAAALMQEVADLKARNVKLEAFKDAFDAWWRYHLTSGITPDSVTRALNEESMLAARSLLSNDNYPTTEGRLLDEEGE